MFRDASNAPKLVVARAHQRYELRLSDRAWAEAAVAFTRVSALRTWSYLSAS
jgi:hypothetical protein